jgi:hypothetical protein
LWYDDTPVPLYAQRTVPGSQYRVYFDRQIQPGTLAAGNWRVIDAIQEYNVTAAVAFANYARLTVTLIGAAPDPEGIYYKATPPDVLSLLGWPAAAFDALPYA